MKHRPNGEFWRIPRRRGIASQSCRCRARAGRESHATTGRTIDELGSRSAAQAPSRKSTGTLNRSQSLGLAGMRQQPSGVNNSSHCPNCPTPRRRL